jgi:hypothetical protein
MRGFFVPGRCHPTPAGRFIGYRAGEEMRKLIGWVDEHPVASWFAFCGAMTVAAVLVAVVAE